MSNETPMPHHSGDEPHLLREIMRTQQALLNVFTREVGMPAARLSLLRVLAICRPERIGTMEIARRLNVNAAAVTRQVREMEGEGLVVRIADRTDDRRRFVELTARGLEIFLSIHERAHEFERSLGVAISAEDIATATRVLVQVRTAIEELHRREEKEESERWEPIQRNP
jgi:DNA-binding MarR family transcriptional regulator